MFLTVNQLFSQNSLEYLALAMNADAYCTDLKEEISSPTKPVIEAASRLELAQPVSRSVSSPPLTLSGPRQRPRGTRGGNSAGRELTPAGGQLSRGMLGKQRGRVTWSPGGPIVSA